MSILKHLGVAPLSNQQPYKTQTPFRRRRISNYSDEACHSYSEARFEAQLKIGPPFIFPAFDATVFKIHLDGRLMHFGRPVSFSSMEVLNKRLTDDQYVGPFSRDIRFSSFS